MGYNRPGDVHFIYLMSRSDGAIKVGCSKNPRRRVTTLRSAQKSAIELKLLAEFPHPMASAVERATHFILSHHSKGAEWFSVSFDQACSAIEHAIDAVDAVLTGARKQGDLKLVREHLIGMAEPITPALRKKYDIARVTIEARLGKRRPAQRAYAEDIRRQMHALKVAEANRRRKHEPENDTCAE